MSMSSLSVNQVLDLWTELTLIWLQSVDEDDPSFEFQLYAYRILDSNPTRDRAFEKLGPNVYSWSDLLNYKEIKDDILSAWAGARELFQRFERKFSDDEQSCEIYINGRRVGDWMDSEMLEVWRCTLEIRYVPLSVGV